MGMVNRHSASDWIGSVCGRPPLSAVCACWRMCRSQRTSCPPRDWPPKPCVFVRLMNVGRTRALTWDVVMVQKCTALVLQHERSVGEIEQQLSELSFTPEALPLVVLCIGCFAGCVHWCAESDGNRVSATVAQGAGERVPRLCGPDANGRARVPPAAAVHRILSGHHPLDGRGTFGPSPFECRQPTVS